MTTLISHWPGQNTPNDVVGSNNAEWQGIWSPITPNYSAGVIGNCFDCVNYTTAQYLYIPYAENISFGNSSKFTIEGYFKTTVTGMVVFERGPTRFTNDCAIIINTGGTLKNIISVAGVAAIEFPSAWVAGEWNKIKVSYDVGYWKMYVNDVEKTPSGSNYYLLPNNTNNWGYFFGGSVYYSVKVDELKIWNDEVLTKTHTVDILNGEIKSWTIVDGGTLPETPNTHEVVMKNGLIGEWNISSGGSRPSPNNNHTIETLHGLVKSWSIE